MIRLNSLLLIILSYLIIFQSPLFSSDDLYLGEDSTESNVSTNYGPFNLYIGVGFGIGMPSGDLLETEKDLLKANNEDYDGINYFHSCNINLQAESVFRLLKASNINFLLGVRGLFGYYAIIHKLNGDKDDYDSDDYDDEDYVRQLLSFGQLLAGPALYIAGESGFFGSIYCLYGKVFGGELTTQPLIQDQPGVTSEKSDFKGKKFDLGFGLGMISNKIFASFSIIISVIDIDLDNKPVIYNDRFQGSKTTIADISLGFAVGFRIF